MLNWLCRAGLHVLALVLIVLANGQESAEYLYRELERRVR